MAEKAKSVRLLKAAKELNIGTSTITSFLEDKGFKVDNKPTAKLSEEMYDVLLREFADEKLIKEKAEQVELGKTIKEAAKQVEEDKEAAAVAAATAAAAAAAAKVEVEVEEPKEEEKVSPKAETLKGPKILGKIDLNVTSKKKEKKKEEPVAKTEKPIKEEKPAPVAKKEEATAPKKEEKPVVAKEEPKDAAEPASKKDEVEKVLDTPDDGFWHMHAMIPIGYPMGNWGIAQRKPTNLSTFQDRWDNPVSWEIPEPLWPNS